MKVQELNDRERKTQIMTNLNVTRIDRLTLAGHPLS